MSKPLTPRREVDRAYREIDRVIQPLTKGDGGDHRGKGGDPNVVAARRAYQALNVITQWARVGAAKWPPSSAARNRRKVTR